MKGFGKQLRMLILCALLICTLIVTASAASVQNCPGRCAHQAAIGTTHYDTLAEAITAAKAGRTVTLLADVTITAPLMVSKPLTLDLGGKILAANLSSPRQAAVCFLGGGAVRDGKIIVSDGSALLVSSCNVTIEKDAALENSGSAPILRMTAAKEQSSVVNVSGEILSKSTAPAIDAASADGICELYILEDAKLTATKNTAIAFDSAGKLDIGGGTIQARKDAVSVTIAQDRKTELAITDGNLLSREGEVVVITAEENAEAPKDFITGGTFQKLPSTYIPSYCQIQQNADGSCTVISAYILTFLPGSGSGTMEPAKIQCGSAIQLPSCSFTAPEDLDFAGWQIDGTLYAPGDTYTPEADVAMTALWSSHEHTGGSATCLKKAVCSICGETYGSLGTHNLNYIGSYGATCTEAGMNDHSKCSLCGNLFVDGVMISASSLTTPALGHSWETVEHKPASCEEDGLKAYRKCTDCGTLQADGKDVAEADLLIPAAGHTLENIAATQATCKEAGIQAHEHCTVCDQLFVMGDSVEAAALTTATSSHVLSDWLTDEHYHWKACVDCGEVFRQNSHTDPDQDGVCNDCGHAMEEKAEDPVETSGFSWLFLIPVIAAVAIAVPLAIKKRK